MKLWMLPRTGRRRPVPVTLPPDTPPGMAAAAGILRAIAREAELERARGQSDKAVLKMVLAGVLYAAECADGSEEDRTDQMMTQRVTVRIPRHGGG